MTDDGFNLRLRYLHNEVVFNCPRRNGPSDHGEQMGQGPPDDENFNSCNKNMKKLEESGQV